MMNNKRDNDHQTRIIWAWFPVTFVTALFCCVLWGSAPAAIKTAYRLFQIGSEDTASRIVLAGTRFVLTGILTILIGSALERKILLPKRASWPRIGILGLVQTAGQYFFYFTALAHISGVRGSIINALGNFITILFAVYIFRFEKMSFRKFAGCLTGLAGVILIMAGGQSLALGGAVTLAGEGAMLITDFFYAAAGCLMKVFSKDEDPVVLCAWQFIAGGLVLLLIGTMLGGSLVFHGTSCAAVLVYLAFISTGAYTLWSVLLKYNPVSRVSILGFFNPVMGVLISAIILGEAKEAFSLTGLVSLVLVSAGVMIVNSGQAGKA